MLSIGPRGTHPRTHTRAWPPGAALRPVFCCPASSTQRAQLTLHPAPSELNLTERDALGSYSDEGSIPTTEVLMFKLFFLLFIKFFIIMQVSDLMLQ